MFSVHVWIHIITVTALAMVFKEYRTLQQVLHEEHRVKLWSSGSLPVAPSTYTLPVNPFDSGTVDRRGDAEARSANLSATLQSAGSSVWCHGTNHTNRLCHFRNVCFRPEASAESVIFFRHADSVLSGVPSQRFAPTLLESSSVVDHSDFFINYVVVPAAAAARVLHEHVYVSDTTLAFRRVLPDNLMHVIHDDLLPAFVTLRHVTAQTDGPFNAQLLLLDTYRKGPYWNLYKGLVSKDIVLRSEQHEKTLICYRDLHVGMLKDTLWYDHGFKEPQQPLANVSLDATTLRQFTRHLRNSLGLVDNRPAATEAAAGNTDARRTRSAVLIVRRDDRVILNEKAVIAELTSLQFDVSVVVAESVVLQQAVEQVSRASLIVGLHDAMLMLAVFAAPHTLLVECFAYALNPHNYAIYRTLAALPGMNVTYATWRNEYEERSLTHPKRDWSRGGIKHLVPNVQFRVRTSVEVPRHRCCYEPQYMYRLYQDTAIDVTELRALVVQHLGNSSHSAERSRVKVDPQVALLRQQMPPGPVTNTICKVILGETHPVLQIFWEAPFNARFVEHSYMLYEVLMQEANAKQVFKWSVRTTFHEVMTHVQPKKRYFIWVRALFDDTLAGPFNNHEILCVT